MGVDSFTNLSRFKRISLNPRIEGAKFVRSLTFQGGATVTFKIPMLHPDDVSEIEEASHFDYGYSKSLVKSVHTEDAIIEEREEEEDVDFSIFRDSMKRYSED